MRILFSPAASASLSSKVCKAPIRISSRSLQRRSTSPCIAARNPTGTASTPLPRPMTFGTPTCRPSERPSSMPRPAPLCAPITPSTDFLPAPITSCSIKSCGRTGASRVLSPRDCGAIDDFFEAKAHHTSADKATAAADGIKTGTDTNCGSTYLALDEAVVAGVGHRGSDRRLPQASLRSPFPAWSV